ncbi:MAG TPA: nicotinate-nucleotide adenylyltransferase [Arenicellales bacterium]|nr:nicotinate-nucleotide adenylyltransferase [Arenicellales bacterium]
MTSLIGLLGGTFDPVHNGHLAVAQGLCDELGADRVRCIPCALPPHRTPPECSAGHRLAMLEAAVAADRRLIADTRELQRKGPSYTVWTLRSLRREFPGASLCWVLGVDAWLGLKSWYRWYELSSLAHLVVVRRPGWELPGSAEARLSGRTADLKRRPAGAAVLWDGPEIDLSASAIRDRIAAGEDVSDALPGAVWEYIRRNKLYGFR